MQLKIVLHGLGHCGALRRGRCDGVLALVLPAAPLAAAAGLLGVEIALVDFDLAPVRDGDEDLAALLLRRLLVLPRMEGLAGFQHHDLGPARREKRVALRGDGLVLQLPEQVRVREIRILREQVADDLAAIVLQREQRDLGRDGLPAEQPLLQLIAARGVASRIVEQRQPLLLLRLRGERQMLDGLGVDLLVAV